MDNALYYESHITIEPVFGEKLDVLRELCGKHRFRVADLLMQKRKTDTPERSKHDTFCTGRGQNPSELSMRMFDLVKAMRTAGYQVWRYKLEAALIDSKVRGDQEGGD